MITYQLIFTKFTYSNEPLKYAANTMIKLEYLLYGISKYTTDKYTVNSFKSHLK